MVQNQALKSLSRTAWHSNKLLQPRTFYPVELLTLNPIPLGLGFRNPKLQTLNPLLPGWIAFAKRGGLCRRAAQVGSAPPGA